MCYGKKESEEPENSVNSYFVEQKDTKNKIYPMIECVDMKQKAMRLKLKDQLPT